MGFIPDSSSDVATAPVAYGGGRFVPDDAAKPNSLLQDFGEQAVTDIKDVGTLAKNVVQPVLHPIQTVKGVSNAVMHPIQTVKAVGQNIADKYGSLEKAGNTFVEHPFSEVLPDAMMAAGGAGLALKGAGAVSKVGELSKAGEVLTDLSVVPVKGVVSGVQTVAKPVIEGASDIATNTGRYFSRIGNTFKPKAIENLNVSDSERISNLATRAKGEANANIQPLQQKITDIQQLAQKAVGSIRESKDVLKKNLVSLKHELQNAAEKGSVEFQKKLPDFFHANSEAYEIARDNAFDAMAQQGKGITNQEVFNAIQKTKQDIADALIPNDAPSIRIINQLENKYNPTVSTQSGIITDVQGNPLVTNTVSKAGKFVDIKELVQDLRNVKSTLTSSAKSGRTGFAQEDLPVGYLNHNLGDYIKQQVPAFASLQKEYSPVIQAMKEAHKIFKPNMGEFNTKTATNFLKQAGTGKLEAGQGRVLSALEEGNKFSTGVGKISGEVKGIGKSMNDIKNQMSKFDDESRKITGSSQAEVAKQQASIANRKAILQKRLDGLEKRRQEVSRLQSNKDVVGKIKNALIGKAVDSTGLGAVKAIIR